MESIIVAAVTGGLALIGTLVGTYFANRKSAALIAYRLEFRRTTTWLSGPIG